jgi:hypothetical protein
MTFIVTPEEAQSAALAVMRHFRKRGMTVKIEIAAWPGAPYRTTLVARKQGLCLLVEAQGILNYGKAIRELATWLAANRHYSELYLATTSDAVIQAGMLGEMRRDGIGLLVVDEGVSCRYLKKLVTLPLSLLQIQRFDLEIVSKRSSLPFLNSTT